MAERGLGVQTVLRSGVSGDHPYDYAETPGGQLLMANGIDPMLAWDGLSSSAIPAGVAAPATAPSLGGIGPGTITGTLVSYQRFIDTFGNTSDLSPVSNSMYCGRDGLVDDVNFSRDTGTVRVRSCSHGLSTNDLIVIEGVLGIPAANGTFPITRVDEDTFDLRGLVITSGLYVQGGVWSLGISTIVYGSVEIPAQQKVARRQILRNLAGNAEVFYVDIDTDDLISTEFMSTQGDVLLSAGEPVPLVYGVTELPYASRHGLPPSHKSAIASHKGRIFASVDRPYTLGHVEPAFNSTQVTGVQTAWPTSLVGRVLYVDGATAPYLITALDPIGQVLTLDRPYLEPLSLPYASYSILPEAGERRLIYFSEPGLPESWPIYNAIGVVENGDSITALAILGNFLYVVEQRHIHRLTFDQDPAEGGYLFLTAFRGSLNQRTFATIEGAIYFLDEIGIHKFDGEKSESVSQPIQTIFQGDDTSEYIIDWTADRSLWHCAHDPVRDTIRWFVTMLGYEPMRHSISYNYRTDRWWIEEYPTKISCSANSTIGHRRSLAGTEARRVICLAEGSYDGVSGQGTMRGQPTSADAITVEDLAGDFYAIEGAPVSIIDGPGVGQQRIVASATSTSFEVDKPWGILPTAASTYQIGGIPWRWRSGWFRFAESEADTNRDVSLVLTPTAIPANLDLRLYFNHEDSPRPWARDLTADGVTTRKGDPRITVDLMKNRGLVQQSLGGHGDNKGRRDQFLAAEISGVQAGAPVRVSQMILNGLEN